MGSANKSLPCFLHAAGTGSCGELLWVRGVMLAGGALPCGVLPEARALPGSWRSARASRRCARRRAGRSAAAGTPGCPSRCSGPFGIPQGAPNRNRTTGDPRLCPSPGDRGSGRRDGDGRGDVGSMCQGKAPPDTGIHLQHVLKGFGCTGCCEPVWSVCVCTRVFHGGLVPHGVDMARK